MFINFPIFAVFSLFFCCNFPVCFPPLLPSPLLSSPILSYPLLPSPLLSSPTLEPDTGVPTDVHCPASGPASVLPSPDLRSHATVAPEPDAGGPGSVLRRRRGALQEPAVGAARWHEHGGEDEHTSHAEPASWTTANGRTGKRVFFSGYILYTHCFHSRLTNLAL